MQALWELLQRYQLFAVVAFVATVFATPLAMRIARRTGVMDFPDQLLKPHARPIPYLGGAAILLGWSAALLWAMWSGAAQWERVLPILLGGMAISIIGLIDDVKNVSPKFRLVGGALVISAVMLTTGAGLRLVDSLTNLGGVHLPPQVSQPLSFLVGLVIVLGACHSTNLIDGLDGLCSGVTAIISAGFFLLAAFLAAWEYSQEGDPVRLVLAISMVGAALGFLPHNFNPARIFMGDAGSTLLGFNCGILILLFGEQAIFRWVVGALMIFALPVFDTCLAMFRRWRSGRSIFAGDRSHFYDQLVRRGLTVRQTVLVCYALTILFGGLGLLVTVMRTRWAILLYLCVWALVAAISWMTGLTHPEERRQSAATASPPAGGS